jgi:hypothetical protein
MSKQIMLPLALCQVLVRADSFNEDANTIDVTFTTGAIVQRETWREGRFDEELIVSPQAVRLDRLNKGAPFLDSHNRYSLGGILGAVVRGSARIADGKVWQRYSFPGGRVSRASFAIFAKE